MFYARRTWVSSSKRMPIECVLKVALVMWGWCNKLHHFIFKSDKKIICCISHYYNTGKKTHITSKHYKFITNETKGWIRINVFSIHIFAIILPVDCHHCWMARVWKHETWFPWKKKGIQSINKPKLVQYYSFQLQISRYLQSPYLTEQFSMPLLLVKIFIT